MIPTRDETQTRPAKPRFRPRLIWISEECALRLDRIATLNGKHSDWVAARALEELVTDSMVSTAVGLRRR